jgi:uncharacterized membrane protein
MTLEQSVNRGFNLLVELVAVPLETDDPAAFGDNLAGLILYVPFFGFVVGQYVWAGRAADPAKA